MLIADAQCVIPTEDLRADIVFFTKTLKMRMDTIYPADDPKVAVFSGHGIAICIDKDASGNLHLVKQNLLHRMALNLKFCKRIRHSFYQKLNMNSLFGV
jgi:hypothetical protein